MIIGTLREAFRYRDPTPTYLISLAPQSSLQLAFKTVFAPPRLLVVTVDAVKLSVTIAAMHGGQSMGALQSRFPTVGWASLGTHRHADDGNSRPRTQRRRPQRAARVARVPFDSCDPDERV